MIEIIFLWLLSGFSLFIAFHGGFNELPFAVAVLALLVSIDKTIDFIS